MADWKNNKDLGPWDCTEQSNKFGYLNNPRWSNQQDAQEFCGEIGLSLDFSDQHKPCGHWHKGETIKIEKKGTACKGGWNKVEMSDDGKYVTLVGFYCICRSDDYGETWASVLEGNFVQIGMSADGKYQTVITTGTTRDVWFSNDYGITWTKDTPGLYKYRGIAVSATGQYQTLVAWNDRIFISSDYGNTWATKGLSKSWWDVAMSSNGKWQVAILNIAEVYVSDDYGNTWNEVFFAFWGTYSKTHPRRVCMSSDGSVIIIASAISYTWGSHYCSLDYGATWVNVGAYWRYISKDVACSSSGEYATIVDHSQLIQVSHDYGLTYVDKGLDKSWTGIALSASGAVQIAVTSTPDPNDNVYKSTDYGMTWNPVEIEDKVVVISSNLSMSDEPQVWPMPK